MMQFGAAIKRKWNFQTIVAMANFHQAIPAFAVIMKKTPSYGFQICCCFYFPVNTDLVQQN